MQKLYVVRHGETIETSDIPPDSWKLSDRAHESIRKMLDDVDLNAIHCFYHSPLVKAADTAKFISDICGIGMEEYECLREARRNFDYIDKEACLKRVQEFLTGHNSEYFEKYSLCQDRIVECIKSLLKHSNGKSIMVVSHGLIITVLYSYILGTRLEYNDWINLKTPDLSIVNLSSNTIEKGFYSGSRVVLNLKGD